MPQRSVGTQRDNADVTLAEPTQVLLDVVQRASDQSTAAASLVHVRRLAARSGETTEWPRWAPPAVRAAFADVGVEQPWRHQVEAADLAWRGSHVVVATGTASGKSLTYQLPALAAIAADDRARVLYLSPTKALAADQLRGLTALGLNRTGGPIAATYDGDTPPDERDWVRAHANWVLTNPDMLSRSVLPGHERWASFFRRLTYVVLDECHAYRGLFGAHVALVLRRLRRLCTHYGSNPTFVLASATAADPALSAARLIGAPVHAVTEDTAPHGETTFVLWEPALTSLRGEHGAPVRRAAGAEAARLLADLVAAGARTLAFVRSRRGAELTALGAQRALRESGAGELADRVAAYRAGYLPEERRALEQALSTGRMVGVACTNALELGIDITGLDAVLLAGYPGTLASLWQQSGRAGRAGDSSLVVFIARDDPLDTYLVHHPEALFDRPVEATVFDPWNPFVLAPHLCCAAAELPIRPAELESLGGESTRALVSSLVDHGGLRRRPHGWYWTSSVPPRADLRGGGGEPITIVERGSGALLGTVDAAAAHASAHTGAVYLHQGRSFVVDHLDLDRHTALVHAETPDWSTSALEVTDIRVMGSLNDAFHGSVGVHYGEVEVSHQVTAYQRRRISNSEVIEEIPLDLPRRELRTRAVWYTVEDEALDAAGIAPDEVPGAVHAAEHAAIGLLSLFATCDRWDIGGVSTARHADTGRATVFVYDGHPGGAGFAERGHEVLVEWLSATRDAISACECLTGCPSCIQSPKCGSGNDPLAKDAAVDLLDLVLAATRAVSRGPSMGQLSTGDRYRNGAEHERVPASHGGGMPRQLNHG